MIDPIDLILLDWAIGIGLTLLSLGSVLVILTLLHQLPMIKRREKKGES